MPGQLGDRGDKHLLDGFGQDKLHLPRVAELLLRRYFGLARYELEDREQKAGELGL